MVTGRIRFLGVIMLLFVCLAAGSVYAEKQLVVDLAGSLTPAERSELQAAAEDLGSQYGMDLVIVTITDAGGKTSRAFADDYFDQNGYGAGDDASGILFLIDFDNREAYISTSGTAIRYLTDQRIESMLDRIVARLAAQDAYGAASAFLDEAGTYLAAGIPSDQYTEVEGNRLTLFEGLLAAAASGLTGLGIFSSTKRQYRGKYQPAVFEFRKNSFANLGIVQDQLVKSYVTSRIRPAQTAGRPGSSSGRSTVHRSSSGRMHGGGGRRF